MSPAEDLRPFPVARRSLEAEARRLGIRHLAFLGSRAFKAQLGHLDPETRARYDCDLVGAAMVVALAFDEGPPAVSGAVPLARIARFARANWYRELVVRLQGAAARAMGALREAGIDPGPPRSWRSLANSGLPERPLALAAGLGHIGRSGLLLVPDDGPGVVLGLLLMPDIFGEVEAGVVEGPDQAREGFPDCGSCRACVDACPTGALSVDRGFDRERCLQHWASRAGSLPAQVEEHWGDRLYGCDSCTESCPRFGGRASILPTIGCIGVGIPAADLASASDGELKARFKGSALGQSWIEGGAIRRSARLCLARAADQGI
ncbi:MAG: 4Fe-4S double cluster binding domain-containing protein [Spirochaetota bacterium]